MKKFLILIGVLTALSACQTTTTTHTRAGYSASGMCMGGATCGNGR